MLRAWVRRGFILKVILCLLLAQCQALPGTVAHVVVTTPPWGNWLWSSFHWWANSDSKTCSCFPKVAWLTGDGAGSWVHFRLHWPRAPALGPCCLQSRGALGGELALWGPRPSQAAETDSHVTRSLAPGWESGGWVALLLLYAVGFCFTSLSDGALGSEGLWQGVGGSPSGQVEAPSEGVLLRSWDRVGMVPLSEAPTPWSHSGCQG